MSDTNVNNETERQSWLYLDPNLSVWDIDPDCKIETIDGEVLNAHKKKLAAVSDMIKTHFFGTLEQNHNDSLKSEYSTRIMKVIRDFAYGNDFEFSINKQDDADFVCAVLKATDFYLMPKLKQNCYLNLANIQKHKVLPLLWISFEFKLYILLDSCMKLMFTNTCANCDRYLILCSLMKKKCGKHCIEFDKKDLYEYLNDKSYELILFLVERVCNLYSFKTTQSELLPPLVEILIEFVKIFEVNLIKKKSSWREIQKSYDLTKYFKLYCLPLSDLKKFLLEYPNVFSSESITRSLHFICNSDEK